MGDIDATKLLGAPQGQKPSVRPTTHKNPAPEMLLGLALMGVWVIIQMLDIETTEAWLLNGKVTTFSPDWAVLLQIPSILWGQPMSIDNAKAYIFSWAIALASLMLLIAFERAIDAVSHANHHLAGWFATGCVGMGLIDLLTNFAYAPGGLEGWKQFIFALVISFGAFFFGVPGYRLLEHGFKTWRH